MTLKTLSDDAVGEIGKVLSTPLTENETLAISKIVEHALAKAVNQTAKSFVESAVISCGPDADIAHKISEEVDRARHALIANLTSLR